MDAQHQRIQGLGIRIEVPIRDESWGDRHFAVRHPRGRGAASAGGG